MHSMLRRNAFPWCSINPLNSVVISLAALKRSYANISEIHITMPMVRGTDSPGCDYNFMRPW